MIVRIPKHEPYYNAIELAAMLAATEWLVAMETIKIYDKPGERWNFRRVFWYIAGLIPALFVTLSVTAASVKYLFG